jgi:uncharacterized protein YrzB (UPF0473 family)
MDENENLSVEEFDGDGSGFDDLSPDILTLEDENGEEHDFEIVDEYDDGDDHYVALVPEEVEGEDSGELVILKSEYVDDEEFLSLIEDEDEFERISQIFVERLSDEFDFED